MRYKRTMKKIFLIAASLFSALTYYSQIVYSNSFNNLGLQTYTTATSVTKYASLPTGFTLINDGLNSNIGSAINPNKPFNEPGLKTTGWAVVFNEAENDTFAVSTSWLDTTGLSVNRWFVIPAITNISANSVLTWLAKAPDANFPDGYEVYGTTNLNASSSQDFVVGDRLFVLADANTAGGGEKNVWTRRSINIGSFAGQTLRFAFRNNSKDMYQLWIDDIKVINAANNLDASISTSTPRKYILINVNDSVKLTVTNLGASAINSVNVSYQVGNSSINTENITFANALAYGQSAAVKFSLPYTLSTQGLYEVKYWINNVNGIQDQNSLNNTGTYTVTVQNSSPAKNILLEQFVSANNGEGPDAQEKTLALQSPSLIIVNIHDLDSLKESGSAALITDYKKIIPSTMVDRYFFDDIQSATFDRPAFNKRINDRANAVTPVSVSVINKIYNIITRELSFTLKADFVGEVKGDYRLNAYLTENHVAGNPLDVSFNGFNQLNGYNGVVWSPYYQQGAYSATANGYVLNYWQYKHQNTLVYSFDGAYGVNGAIPSNANTQGQSYQQTFTVIIPASANGVHRFNPDNIYLVGFVAEYGADLNNRNVLNCVKEKLTANAEAVGINEIEANSDLLVYPNPSAGIFYFNMPTVKGNYEISVFDVLGKCVKIVEVSNARNMEALDLSALQEGVYVLKMRSGNEQFTGKLIIQK